MIDADPLALEKVNIVDFLIRRYCLAQTVSAIWPEMLSPINKIAHFFSGHQETPTEASAGALVEFDGPVGCQGNLASSLCTLPQYVCRRFHLRDPGGALRAFGPPFHIRAAA